MDGSTSFDDLCGGTGTGSRRNVCFSYATTILTAELCGTNPVYTCSRDQHWHVEILADSTAGVRSEVLRMESQSADPAMIDGSGRIQFDCRVGK